MKVIIHRGTNQIGGCLTEIQSNSGIKILIDIGANLPDADGNEKTEIELEGLTKGTSSYDAIFITHYHGDHIGLYNKVNSDIPIYIGKISKGIYTILQKRLNKVEKYYVYTSVAGKEKWHLIRILLKTKKPRVRKKLVKRILE